MIIGTDVRQYNTYNDYNKHNLSHSCEGGGRVGRGFGWLNGFTLVYLIERLYSTKISFSGSCLNCRTCAAPGPTDHCKLQAAVSREGAGRRGLETETSDDPMKTKHSKTCICALTYCAPERDSLWPSQPVLSRGLLMMTWLTALARHRPRGIRHFCHEWRPVVEWPC